MDLKMDLELDICTDEHECIYKILDRDSGNNLYLLESSHCQFCAGAYIASGEGDFWREKNGERFVGDWSVWVVDGGNWRIMTEEEEKILLEGGQ